MSRVVNTLVASIVALGAGAPSAHAQESAPEASYDLERVGPPYVVAGDEVMEVLTATGEDGSPLAGLSVRFVRTGPRAETAESCSVQNLSACDVTSENGTAYYQFGVGIYPGVVEVRAEVYSPEGLLVGEAGPEAITVDTVTVCRTARGFCPLPHGYLQGHSKRGRDIIQLFAPTFRHGSSVVLLRRVSGGWVVASRVKTLNRRGDGTFSVRDHNGSRPTRYQTVILPSARYGAESSRIALR
jgi:hypothetical protein